MILKHKVVLITGANRGLGLCLVKECLIEGYLVIAVSKNIQNLKSLTKNRSIENDKLIIKKCDVSNERNIINTAKFIKSFTNKIDVVINNAGVRFEDSIQKTSLKRWNKLLSINLTGSFLITKYFLPFLIKAKKGIIINISSIRGIIGARNLAAYSASKFGMIGFTHSLAEEISPLGLKCYAICPAGIRTDMNQKTSLSFSKKLLIKPIEISKSILQLINNRLPKSGKTIVILGKQEFCKEKLKQVNNYKYIIWH